MSKNREKVSKETAKVVATMMIPMVGLGLLCLSVGVECREPPVLCTVLVVLRDALLVRLGGRRLPLPQRLLRESVHRCFGLGGI